MSASSTAPSLSGIVSPLDESTNSTLGSHSVFSDKESVEPERGLFTITDEDRPPHGQSHPSPLPTTLEHPDSHNAQWPLDNKSPPTGPEVVPVEKEMLHGQRHTTQAPQRPIREDMSDKEALTPAAPKKQSSKWWLKRSVLIILALILVVIIGLAVGLGVGLGLKKNNSQSISSNPANLTDTSFIQNGSSIAAVESGTGDRFVFFQDGQNNIRWVGYSSSTSKWIATNTLATTIQPKPGSPLVAFVMPGSDLTSQSLIHLIYIANNANVIELEVAPDKTVQTVIASDSRNLLAATDAMRMSVSSSLRPGSNDTIDTFLMFRTSNSVGLWQRIDQRSTYTFGDTWYDATNDLLDPLDGTTLCEPFSASSYFAGTINGTAPATLARFVSSNCDPTSPVILSSVYSAKDNSITTTSSQAYSYNSSSTTSSIHADPAIIQSGWVGTQNASEWYFVADKSLKAFSLQSNQLNQSVPDVSVPYPQLATLHYIYGVKSNALYNQLDNETFAEHVYDTSKKAWSTKTVDISDIPTA